MAMQRFLWSLAELFPALPFAASADKWLDDHVSGITIREQLLSRSVRAIEFIPIISTAGVGFLEGNKEFIFYFNDYASPEWLPHALGHEIGHTFHYDLTKHPLHRTIPEMGKMDSWLYDEVEQFCDEFSNRWLSRVNVGFINKAFENQKKCIGRGYIW